MKLIIFSDIHGNYDAFSAFLQKVKEIECDYFVFCGDIFGYYYNQTEILDQLCQMKKLIWLKGNHDEYFLKLYQGEEKESFYIENYGHSYDNVTERYDQKEAALLSSRDSEYVLNTKDCKIGIFHGTPADPLEGRLYPNNPINSLDDYSPYDIVILGHTHCRMNRMEGNTLIINPGSLGQPRDGKGYSFGILDTEKKTFLFENVSFDSSRLYQQIEENDPNLSKLKEVLERRYTPRKILVTAISGNVSNGILKILKNTGDEVYGCDIYDYPVGMDKVITFWKSDLAISPNYIPNLLSRCREYGITHLIPVNETEIQVIGANLNRFSDAGIKVMIHSFDILDIFLDKYKTSKYLGKIPGIHVPDTYRCEEFTADGREYIVKLNHSCGSKFFEVIKKKEELEQLSIPSDDFVIQEYLSKEDEYTVGVFSDGNHVSVIIFKRKLEHGYTSFVELVHDETIEREAAAIAERIHLRGYINLQLRKRDHCNYIFEINPRISGTVYFRHMLGFHDVLWWLELLDGNSVPTYKCNYETAIGMRELSEKFVIEKST